MLKRISILLILTLLLAFTGCGSQMSTSDTVQSSDIVTTKGGMQTKGSYKITTRIDDVINDPVFENYGRLIFPVDEYYYSGETLGDLSLVWYSQIQPETTVEIANYFRSNAKNGKQIFYPIYSEEEIKSEPDKADEPPQIVQTVQKSLLDVEN